MTISVIINYGRSGGTLLNRCIGSLSNVVMMSEVGPLRTGHRVDIPITVARQAKEWYQIDLQSTEFVESIAELEQLCTQQGKHLVVRLWCVAEFRPARQNNGCPPGYLMGYQMLRERFSDIPAVALIRDPIDIWISNGCKRDFFAWYRNYIDQVFQSGVPIFRYEDFCVDAVSSFKKICRSLKLPYSEDFLNFSSFNFVRGDMMVPGGSRGSKLTHVENFRRRQIATADIRWVDRCEDMKQANRTANYPLMYSGREREGMHKRIIAEIRYVRRVIGL